MKIYTKGGDAGTTALFTGERVPKDSIRVETYGIVDEFDSALGIARAWCKNRAVREEILTLQKMLGSVMAEIASSGEDAWRVSDDSINQVEHTIDKFNELLAPLTHFIIPGDTPGGAALDLARTVARRAERQLWRLKRIETVNEKLLVYFNRLSDLCFVLARCENEIKG